ncbi:MAG: DegT/DnrJ/EryC1/StrS family aminotransferase [Planctomycetota bacterium]|nr:DegT/DnrJ/EryC1/StrS family aminotransferase [Planctomycetota bacterium]
MERIPVAGPSITQREIDYVTDAVTTCWYGEANKYHAKFEQAFAEYIGVRHAVSLPSCTSAIHLSLAALGVGPGDEVIVPDVTWIASAAPISYVGATAVFADIDERSWCLSPQSFETCITKNTKAVIVVDLYGSMPEMARIREIAARHGIAVVEDAAEAFGSQIGDRMAGSFGDTGVFSFHGSKTMTTGEGGMLVTDRDDLFERACFLRDHGRVPGDVNFFNHEVAFKYKMSSMQAALGLAQVERAEELVGRKREIFSWYEASLAALPGVSLNATLPGTTNSYWMSTIVLDSSIGLDKVEFGRALAARGVDTRPFFHPLSSIPAYQHDAEAAKARTRNVASYQLSPCGVNLPCGLSLTREQADFVCDQVRAVLAECGISAAVSEAA